ncbi:MAG TPA: phage major capsid protein [Tepidisphaeraceae bacterium]|nr:phage major capsid protein [Tepidisphaeraceae bacterium]
MSWQLKKKYTEERAQHLADLKAMLKKAEDEKRDLTTEENTKFDEISTKAEQRKADIERIDRAIAIEASATPDKPEQRAGQDDINTPEQKLDEKAQELREQFDRYLRGTSPVELRALTVAGTGVVGDRPFYNQLVTSLKTWAGVRQAGATVLPTSDGNPLTVPTGDDTANEGQIVGEGATDNTNADPAIGNVTLNAFRFDSKWIKVSLEMLRDTAFPIEQYIQNIAGERIGRTFNRHSTIGTGVGQPKGFITAAGTGKVAALTNAITYEELLDLIHAVDAGYRNSPGFRLQCHDLTVAAIRKLKDGNGSYIWAAGAAGAPSQILGYGYVVNNDMDTLASGANKSVVAAGDFSRYFVRDVTGVEVVRASELFIGDGLIGFRVFSRHDGNLTDAKSVKVLKTAAA